jgi:hypothetical protein
VELLVSFSFIHRSSCINPPFGLMGRKLAKLCCILERKLMGKTRI